MHATMADVRAEYVMALWDILEGLQRLVDEEIDSFLKEHPEYEGSDGFERGCPDFMCELFDFADCEWTYANTFRLYTNIHEGVKFAIDSRIPEILLKPDEAWFGGGFYLAYYDGLPCIAVDVSFVDAGGDFDVDGRLIP